MAKKTRIMNPVNKNRKTGVPLVKRIAKRKSTTSKRAIQEKPDITIREAVKISMDYFKAIYPNDKPTVEELEISDDGLYWLVTLGTTHQVNKNFGIPAYETKYKRFKIGIKTGKVISMKIRSI